MTQSLFDFDEAPLSVDDLKTECKRIYIKYEDLVFSPIPQMLCQNCGQFGRSYVCPPFSRKYIDTKEHLKKYNKFLLIISESNKEDILKRYKYEIEECKVHEWKAWFYSGTQANAINLGKVRKDMRTILRFLKTRYDNINFLETGGGCNRCRPCKKNLKLPCEHPNEARASMEGSGIDVYATLNGIGYDVHSPPITKYISVVMIFWEELI